MAGAKRIAILGQHSCSVFSALFMGGVGAGQGWSASGMFYVRAVNLKLSRYGSRVRQPDVLSHGAKPFLMASSRWPLQMSLRTVSTAQTSSCAPFEDVPSPRQSLELHLPHVCRVSFESRNGLMLTMVSPAAAVVHWYKQHHTEAKPFFCVFFSFRWVGLLRLSSLVAREVYVTHTVPALATNALLQRKRKRTAVKSRIGL